jgi:ribosomal protein S18 acetylase RimI-like enzyme
VAEVDSRIAGYALYHFGYDTDRGQRLVHLIDLYVSPSFRRSGIGERLMRRLSDIGRSQGAEYMLWSVLKSNALAIRFYEKQGAQHVEHVQFMWRPIQS